MFVTFNESTKKVIKLAVEEKESLNHPYLGTEHIILAILKTNNNIKKVLNKNGVNYIKFKNKLIDVVGISKIKSRYLLYTPLLKKILLNSVMEAKEQRKRYVTTDIVVSLILEEQNGSACTILELLNANPNRILFDIRNSSIRKKHTKQRLLLYELGTDLNKKTKKNIFDPVLGREKEVELLSEILLRRKKNNPILVGDAGVGKTAIVEELARRIVEGKVPKYLKGKQIVALNIFQVVAGTKYRGEFEDKMKTIIRELEENKNIILFIDEIHTIVGAGGAEGAIDASNIFKPALARGDIKVIGATTTREYEKHMKPDAALSRRFQKIEVKEPDKESLTKILLKIKPIYEKHHDVKINNSVLDEIINLSKKYIKERKEPDRSIDILDEVCARVSIKETNSDKKIKQKVIKLKKLIARKNNLFLKDKYKEAFDLKEKENQLKKVIQNYKPNVKQVTKKDVREVIELKSGCAIINKNDNVYYENLKNRLNQKLVNQKTNVNKVIDYLKIKNFYDKEECFSLLILGKKGVGKTFFSKVLASELAKNTIVVDMPEASELNSLLKKVKHNPFSAIIIDNLSDAKSEVQDMFLSILKTSKYYDSNGNKIDFSNTTIILNEVLDDKKKLGFDDTKSNNNFDFISNKIFLEEKPINDIKQIVFDKVSKYNINKNEVAKAVCEKIESGLGSSNMDKLIEEEINKLVLNNL